MNNFISWPQKKLWLLAGFLLSGSLLLAQVQLNQLNDPGSSIYELNDQGQGILGNGYYDFDTNTPSTTEDGVGETDAITNSGLIVGQIQDENGNYVPGWKDASGDWVTFPTSAFSSADGYVVYDISQNGEYVVGQTNWTVENGAWGFVYDTQSETLSLLDGASYTAGAAYAVNDNGIAVGWVQNGSGTRLPAYFEADGTIHLIQNSQGEAHGINNNNKVVGFSGSASFMYDIDQDEYTAFSSIPDGFESSSLSDISDNGTAVGYVQHMDPLNGNLRMPIIYNEQLGDQPQLLTDMLDEWDVDYDNGFTGQGYRISPNGKYIAGWTSGPAFMAQGWALYLADVLGDDEDGYCIPERPEHGNPDLPFEVDPITEVSLENLMDTDQNVNSYNDKTSGYNVPDLTPGETYSLTINGDGNGSHYAAAWIDYNDNQSFEDSELLGMVETSAPGSATIDFSVPDTLSSEQHRLRVLWQFDNNPPEVPDPCTEDGWGQTEDYTVNIAEGSEGGDEGQVCSQGTPSNDFETGVGSLANYNIANDFVVNGDETAIFSLDTVAFDVLVDPGQTIDNVDLTFYNDDAGNGPGDEISSLEGISPSSVEVIGEDVDIDDDVWDVLRVTVALDNPIDFEGTDTQTVYWVGVQVPDYQGDNIKFELVSELDTPNDTYVFLAGSWHSTADLFGVTRDGVLTLSGICHPAASSGGGGEAESCNQITPSNNFENGVGSLTNLIIANDLELDAGESFDLDSLTFNAVINPGTTISSVNLHVYKDGANGPGEELTTLDSIVPAAAENIGSISGYDVVTIHINLANAIALQGHAGNAVYWIGLNINYSSEQSFMETTSVLNTPHEIYVLDPDVGEWLSGTVEYGVAVDGVISFFGQCTALPVCEDTPEAGTIDGGDFSICSGNTLVLTVSGNSLASGISFQWQERDPEGDPDAWSDIDGATDAMLVLPDGITEATDFRLVVTCEESGESATTPPVSATLNSPLECFCIPTFSNGCSDGDMVDTFILEGENQTGIDDENTGCSPNAYDDRTDESVDLAQGLSYIATISTQYTAGGDHAAIWIDFNDDGIFEDEEMVGYLDDMLTPSGDDLTLTIPTNAQTGEHRMRVMVAYLGGMSGQDFDPCNTPDDPGITSLYGEAHDYMANIIENLSVVEQTFESFTYYPNPTNGQLRLQAGQQIEEVNVFNLLGQQIISLAPNSLHTQLDMTNMSSGVYLMKVHINGVTKTFRVIKQ